MRKASAKKVLQSHIPAPSLDGGLQEDDGVDGVHDGDLGVAHELGVALTWVVGWLGGFIYHMFPL